MGVVVLVVYGVVVLVVYGGGGVVVYGGSGVGVVVLVGWWCSWCVGVGV